MSDRIEIHNFFAAEITIKTLIKPAILNFSLSIVGVNKLVCRILLLFIELYRVLKRQGLDKIQKLQQTNIITGA